MGSTKEQLVKSGVWNTLKPAVVFCKFTGEELLSGSYSPDTPTIFYGGFTFHEVDLTQDQWKNTIIQLEK